ncbi:MAG: cobalt ECF transporter T component CbiQ [Gemmataceae bacterium]|nr:cobalt ECF transporter T component CbiQ [Gemmataceae bacterium]
MTLAARERPVPPSPLARWDARWKLAAVLIAVAGVASLNHLPPAAVALGIGLGLLALARLPGRWVRVRLAVFAVAAVPFLVVLPFTLDGPGREVGPVRVSERGVVSGLAVLCRSLAIGSLVLVLVGTAPLHRTFAAAAKLRVPGVLVLLALLAYRYTFLLADELRRMRTAARVRGFRPAATRHGYRTVGHLAGAVLVRGADRADRVAEAMRCRGFDGRFHTVAGFRATAADVAGFVGLAAGTIALVLWDRLGPS